MKILGVIPARYKSSRFPGKPLADICGKPMIWWVYQQAKKVEEFSEVFVATDSKEIEEVCKNLNMNCILTSEKHSTGTDRVGEVAEKIPADWYVIIMGDEPMLTAEDEKILIRKIQASPAADACMLVERFDNPVDVINATTIKLALNDDGDVIFMTRAAIPYPKGALNFNYYKNVGCYAMKKNTLDFFRDNRPGNIERAEEIELLRLIEKHKIIKTAFIDTHPMSVDTLKDLDRIREYFSIQKALHIPPNYAGGGIGSIIYLHTASVYELEAVA